MGSTNGDGDALEGGDHDNSRSWLAYFGEELRLARESCGMSVRQLASHTSYSYQQVSNVEAVLRRPIGGRSVMAEQLERLLKESESPNATIQILPFAAGAHAATDGSFILWTYHDRPDVLYVEGVLSATLREKASDVESTRLTYDLLQAAALPREQSADMIREALEGLST